VTAALSPTDEQLLAAVGRREPGALEVLYDRHHGLALGLARRILRDADAAEDAVQEVFLAVWRQAERYRPERGSVKTWLLAMVHHRAVDRLRQRQPVGGPVELDEMIEDRRAGPVWQQAFEQIRGQQISAALEALPAEQR